MITLSWMMEQLRHHLAFELSTNTLMAWDRFQLIRPQINDLLKHESSHWLTKEVNARLAKEPKDDLWNDGNKTRSLNIAADVLKSWATGPIIDSFEGEMKDAGTETRTPGNYRNRSPGQSASFRLGPTNEQMHPSIAYRMEKLGAKYKPPALANFKREPKKDSNGHVSYEWVNKEIHIPEYKIRPEMPDDNIAPQFDQKSGLLLDDSLDRFERLVISGDPSATAFIGKLDREYGYKSWAAIAQDPNRVVKQPEAETHENQGFNPASAGF